MCIGSAGGFVKGMSQVSTSSSKEELRAYLKSKKLEEIFQKMAEKLLIEKPHDPLPVMIAYLQNLQQTQRGLTPRVTPRAATTPRQAAPVQNNGILSDEDEDEECEDGVHELPSMPSKPPPGPVKRRTSVSAESLDPNKTAAEVRKVSKKEEESQRILKILANNKFLAHLDDKQIKTLEEAFAPVEKKEGETIIQQGDLGDNWYVLDSGAVEVYKNTSDKQEIKVHQYTPGDSFGELALMYNAPRAATCKAATDVKLWALDRISFKTIIMHAAISKRNLHQDFLLKVEILKSCDTYELMTIADCLQEENFNEGDLVVQEGDEGDSFYIVKEGEATCLQLDQDGINREVAHLKSGMYFGEIALLTSKKRQATVIAGPGLKLLSLDRHTFKRVLGPIEDILRRNMAAYTSYVLS